MEHQSQRMSKPIKKSMKWILLALVPLLILVFIPRRLLLAQDTVPPNLPRVAMPAPEQPVPAIPDNPRLDKTPPRQTKGLDLVKVGWSYNCMECHRILEVKWHKDRVRVEHEEIELQHGNNRFCLNCHNPKDMNTFVDYDGTPIPEKDVVLLCAKCHGTTYRDWKAGAHGRRNGFWNTDLGDQTRLRCIQCHDPHHPQFKSMQALPAPVYPARAAGKAEGHEPH